MHVDQSEAGLIEHGSGFAETKLLGGTDMNATRSAVVLLLALVTPASAAGPADAPPGAAACSGCHPTARFVDTTVPRLIGRNPADLVTAMQAFKSGQLPGTVMDRIAKGFSEDEIKAIAAWYGAQKD
jgi:cytochrome subunit of sulfide dehydrogenase